MEYTNSSLVSYTRLSPNHSGQRTHAVDRITPHCVVGQCSVETLGNIFAVASRQTSSNYGIGPDGRVGMYVEEKNRSWCSSSSANDQRAVTIEIASDTHYPYAMKDAAYNKLVDLCIDICKRNGKRKLIWIANKNTALAYVPKPDEMLLTVHRWFANKSCPGDWLYSRLNDLASKVTAKLNEDQIMYRVQVGAFGKKENAENQLKAVKAKGFDGFIVYADGLYKVQVGAFAVKENADAYLARIKAVGFDGFITTKSGAQILNSSPRKSDIEIAKEILKGICSDSRWSTWGNGAVRVQRLKAAGYNPYSVQAEVNKLFK